MAQSVKKIQKNEQDDKIQLELIASNNHNPFWQSSLFNEVYLLNDVPVKYKELWETDEAGPFFEFCNQFRNLCEELKDTDFESWSERNTINRFIKPVLKMLGYTGTATQEPWAEDEPFTIKEDGESKTYKPDLIIVNDPKELKYIERKKGEEKVDEARSSVILAIEAKYWGRIDDLRVNSQEDINRSDKKTQADSARSLGFDEQCLKYMDILSQHYGILTDGKTWRLFSRELSNDTYKRNFQFNLGHLLKHVNASELDKSNRDYEIFIENAKYFFHLFSKSSVCSVNGEQRFVDELLEYSKKYVTRIEEDLRERFVKAMAFACNGYLRASNQNKTTVDLPTIRNVAESHLFNILFIRHCESRNILPLKQSPEYRKISLSNTIGKLEHFNPEKEEDNLNIPTLKRMFSKDFSYSPDGTELYDRLLKLTKIVQDGTKFSSEGFEIKGFKESIFSKEEWAFVSRHKLSNSEMVNILFELGYCESDISGRKFQQIPYNFFAPRQLGSIYESFLEFKIDQAKEDMAFIKKQWSAANLKSDKIKRLDVPKVKKRELYFTPDNEDRKATGSYYTPDNVVKFILAQTIVPVVKNKKAKDILSLRICDPAMGSGHFLSAAVNYLARVYLEKLDSEINDDVTITIGEAKQLILHNCIYGVDINPRAVKLAKMSLWMESASSNSSLESLDDQIHCFNSLDGKSKWEKNFPQIFKNDGFDLIVGNPPYVALDDCSEDVRKLAEKNDPEIFTSSNDIYYHFLNLGQKLLKKNGNLGFITSRYYLEATHASKLRKFLGTQITPFRVVDFQNVDPFNVRIFDKQGKAHVVQKGVGAKTAIICFTKSKDEKNDKTLVARVMCRNWERNSDTLTVYIDQLLSKVENQNEGYLREEGIEAYNIPTATFLAEKWDIKPQAYSAIFSKISKDNLTLGSLRDHGFIIGQGMVTGKDDAFTMSKEDTKDLNKTEFLPLIKNGGIRRFKLSPSGKYWVTPHRFDSTDKKGLKLLERRKSELLSRGDFKKGRAKYEWYEYSRVQNPELFNFKYKIVTPYKSFRNNFAVDSTGAIFSADVYGIGIAKGANPYMLVSLLNSSLAEFAIKYNAKKIDYRYEYYEEALTKLPLSKSILENLSCDDSKKITDKQIDSIEKMSNKEICEVLASVGKQMSTHGETPAFKAVIDKCVGKLYGLSAKDQLWLSKFVDQELADNSLKDESADADEFENAS